jgi:hypothetical protein
MIFKLEDFQQGELRLPNSKNAPNGVDRTAYLNEFIERYEREVLIFGLGVALYNRLKVAIQENDTSDSAINTLLQGATYTVGNKDVIWNGLQAKDSFIAYYIYSKYVRQHRDELTALGTQKPEANNSKAVAPLKRITYAYREFFERYQGENHLPVVRQAWAGQYLDYYGTDRSIRTLYQFLRDNKNDYPDAVFTPMDNVNTFGI